LARIIAAVMGDSLGHLNQILAVADGMREHEFLFVGGGTVLELRRSGYQVEELPVAGTLYANNRLDVWATLTNGIKVNLGAPRIVHKVRRIIRDFDPALILTSWEYFVPIVGRAMGKCCVSIDNQHFITKCRHDSPEGESMGRTLFWLSVRLRHFVAQRHIINTFFPVTPLDPSETDVFPPLIAPRVMKVAPSDGEHVLVYQTSPTFERLFTLLEEMPNRFVIYGFGKRPARKNLELRAPSRERFVEELASCRYVITNGGHTAISEALYFGKPVFAFPIHLAYEQYFNARMLAALGYGEYSMDPAPRGKMIQEFEKKTDLYRANIRGGDFCGNDKVIRRLQEIVQSQESRISAARTYSQE